MEKITIINTYSLRTRYCRVKYYIDFFSLSLRNAKKCRTKRARHNGFVRERIVLRFFSYSALRPEFDTVLYTMNDSAKVKTLEKSIFFFL